MISPETIERIKALMEEASVFEEDLDESFILGGFLLAIVMTPIAYFTVKRLVVRGRAFRLMLAKRKAAKAAARSGASAQ